MDKLKNAGVTVYRTDENGTVVAVCDGNTITFNTAPGSYNGGSSNNDSQTTTPVNTNPSTSSSQEPSTSTSTGHGLIKGNINSKGEKIYHVPGGAYYDRTIPEVWFNTEEEAQAAGFRKSLR